MSVRPGLWWRTDPLRMSCDGCGAEQPFFGTLEMKHSIREFIRTFAREHGPHCGEPDDIAAPESAA